MNEVKSLREVAIGFSAARIKTMIKKIEESFARRDEFEKSQGLAIEAKNSYTTERDRMLKNSTACAMFFLALEVEPSAVIERQVAENAMFNAKALKKVTELAKFTCGYGERLEKVLRAFIACAIIADEKGHDVITNDVNRKFLCGADFTAQVADQELIAHLDELRLRSMTSGAETQSSQARNVLDVLGLGVIQQVNKPRDAISLNSDHAFFAHFKSIVFKK